MAKRGGVGDASRLACRAAGCARRRPVRPARSGPNFKRPPPPAATGLWQRAHAGADHASAEGTGGGAQRFVAGMDIPSQWWTLFQSPQAQSPGRAGAEGQSGCRRRAGGAAASARAVFGAADQLLSDRAGELQRALEPRTPSVPSPIRPAFRKRTPTTISIRPSSRVSYLPDVFGATRRAGRNRQGAESRATASSSRRPT